MTPIKRTQRHPLVLGLDHGSASELQPQDERPKVSAIGWGDEEAGETLRFLADEAEALARGKIAWYLRKKEAKKRLSLWLRASAIILAVAGGVCPLIGGSIGGIQFIRLGYVLLGAGAGLTLFDSLFGASSSWMRFVSAAQQLEWAVDRFRMTWSTSLAQVADGRFSSEEKVKTLSLLSAFVNEIHSIVADETNVWIGEFQSGLARLERNVRDGGTSSSQQ